MKPFFKENVGETNPQWVGSGDSFNDAFTQVIVWENTVNGVAKRAHFFGMFAKTDAMYYLQRVTRA